MWLKCYGRGRLQGHYSNLPATVLTHFVIHLPLCQKYYQPKTWYRPFSMTLSAIQSKSLKMKLMRSFFFPSPIQSTNHEKRREITVEDLKKKIQAVSNTISNKSWPSLTDEFTVLKMICWSLYFLLTRSQFSVKYDMFSGTVKVRGASHTVIQWNIDSIFWTGKIITAWCLVRLWGRPDRRCAVSASFISLPALLKENKMVDVLESGLSCWHCWVTARGVRFTQGMASGGANMWNPSIVKKRK